MNDTGQSHQGSRDAQPQSAGPILPGLAVAFILQLLFGLQELHRGGYLRLPGGSLLEFTSAALALAAAALLLAVRRGRPAQLGTVTLTAFAAIQLASAGQPALPLRALAQALLLVLVAGMLLGPVSSAIFWRAATRRPFYRSILAGAGAVFAAEVSGAARAASDQSAACRPWPLCPAGFPPASVEEWLYLVHLLAIGTAGMLLARLLLQAWRRYPQDTPTLTTATLSAALFSGQVLIGALRIPHPQPGALIVLHALTSLTVWSALVALASFAAVPEPGRLQQPRPWQDFLQLTKPLIVLLLLFTTFTGMVLAQQGLPRAELLAATLLAGALAAGGSGAINHYIDRDLDAQMARTAGRPIAAGRLFPAEGLAFGLGLLVLSFYLMVRFVNLPAALLSLGGMLYYLLVYSVGLKRRTAWNIVIGGGAGAIPPLVGWAASAGKLDFFAVTLFAIVFLWTPVHFWSLALVRQPEYAAVAVPMLPVVKGRRHTAGRILASALLLVGCTWLVALWGPVHLLYQAAAVVTGAWLLRAVYRLWRSQEDHLAWQLYRFSNLYLGMLFLALVLDAIVKLS